MLKFITITSHDIAKALAEWQESLGVTPQIISITALNRGGDLAADRVLICYRT